MKSCARTFPLQGDEEWLKEMYLRRKRDLNQDGATNLVFPSMCHFSVLSLNKRSPSNTELELRQGLES